MPETTVPPNVLSALHESEARFEAFIEESPAAAWMKDEEGRYVYANTTMTRICGVSKESVFGRTDVELFPEEVARQLQRNDEEVRRTNKPLQTVERIPTSGRLHSWSIWKFPFERGGHLFVGGIAFDVTDQNANEAIVRRIQKLESIGRLAAGIAHDFNNLLTIQQVYLSLVLADPSLHDSLRESVEGIAAASERAASLTRQLLVFSRKQIMRRVPSRLDEVVYRVAKMLGRVLGEHVVMSIEAEDPGPRVCADAAMLEQVIVNLVLNARDAMPEGGRLELDTRQVTVDAEAARLNPEARPGRFARFTVTDTGVGISEENLAKLFEPFFTTKEVGKGIGLGLPTVYGIVKQHDGWIEVSSAVGHGTTIRVYLPTADEETLSPPSSREEEQPASGRETILVVEDETPLRRVVRMILERRGYRVLTAVDGVEALRVWSEHQGEIDLLLTDLVMPLGVSGLELARRLRRDRPHLKVLFTSGYCADTNAQEELASPHSAFLQKPYVARLLERSVRELLDAR